MDDARLMRQGDEALTRVVIEGVKPEIDAGRFPVKRTLGEKLVVEADVFADGNDALSCVLKVRKETESTWREVPMSPRVNDRWSAEVTVTELGKYLYTLEAWVDPFKTWQRDLQKKRDAGQDVEVELEIGAKLVAAAAGRASGSDAGKLAAYAVALRAPRRKESSDPFDAQLTSLMERYPDRSGSTLYGRELPVVVDEGKARCSAWYEMFPRSCAPVRSKHGTFKDAERRLPYIAAMGFDVLYLPPIHPIGRAFRKGKNNTLKPGRNDPGSPWAIGSPAGGHKATHPQLGSLTEFKTLVRRARHHGLEVAMDVAFQCSPDHPYVREHPEWFRHRPDGTIQYAENPPKKYQDIYPLDFETPAWAELWDELKSVVLFWASQGIRIFRVDNPHTKSFGFWEWLIAEVKKAHPEAIFLAEAFTRPKVMMRLAKLGFTQSYSYFAWRNTKSELTDYFTELTQTDVREFFRPNLWPNTPDILTEYLQIGGRPAFVTRLVLAATLGANYGIYGPAFELGENQPIEPGSEEYLNSEKYEIRCWDLEKSGSLRDLIGRVNRVRRENAALQSDRGLRFHDVDNEQLICYSKRSDDGDNVILVVVNLDPHHVHSGWVHLDLEVLGVEPTHPFQVHDLLTDARYLWEGPRNYVELNPQVLPAHVFRVRYRMRTEQDFDYFM